MEFHSGALVTIVMSFDVARHDHRPIEIYGSEGAISVPDPNWFGGADRDRHRGHGRLARGADASTPTPTAISACIGVADMAQAIRTGRPHRASGELAFHVLEVMEAFQRSSDAGTAHRHRKPAGAAGHAAGRSRQRDARLKRRNPIRRNRQCVKH